MVKKVNKNSRLIAIDGIGLTNFGNHHPVNPLSILSDPVRCNLGDALLTGGCSSITTRPDSVSMTMTKYNLVALGYRSCELNSAFVIHGPFQAQTI